MDEIWIYQFARRILYNQIPYRDYFMIVAPFQAQINSLILRIFSDQLYVLRIFAYLMALSNLYLFFLISVRLSFSKNTRIMMCLVFVICYSLFPIINYSWFAIFFLTLILWLLLVEKNAVRALLIGLMTSLLLLTKQNIGIYMIFGLTYIFLKFRRRFVLFVLLGFFLGLFPEIVYFYYHHALPDFISIFYGNIFSFYYEFSHPIFVFSALFLFICSLVYVFIVIRDEKLVYLIIFALVASGFMFPIFDLIHFIFTFPFLILLFQYRFLSKSKLIVYFLFFVFCFQGFNWYFAYQKTSLSTLKHFARIPLEKETKKNIESATQYIRKMKMVGKNCYVIDFTSVLIDISLDRFSLKYDSMMAGNFGEHGERDTIKLIEEDKNAIVLVLKTDKNPKQQTAITEYVKTNWLQIPSFNENYLVYVQHK